MSFGSNWWTSKGFEHTRDRKSGRGRRSIFDVMVIAKIFLQVPTPASAPPKWYIKSEQKNQGTSRTNGRHDPSSDFFVWSYAGMIPSSWYFRWIMDNKSSSLAMQLFLSGKPMIGQEFPRFMSSTNMIERREVCTQREGERERETRSEVHLFFIPRASRPRGRSLSNTKRQPNHGCCVSCSPFP